MSDQGRIALVGEAFGAEEEQESARQGKPCPFVGKAGKFLNTMLQSAGIDRANCLTSNVLNLRPPSNDFEALLVKKDAGAPGWPPVMRGKYMPPELMPEVARLHRELAEWNPDVIIALGSKALWALCKASGLANRHGFVHRWTAWAAEGDGPPYPTLVIPTWHPAGIFRKYSQFLPAVNDLRKARRISLGNWPFEQFDYNASPTLADIKHFSDWLLGQDPIPWLSVDIETKPKFRSITHIGIATEDRAISVSLWSPAHEGQSYWKTPEEEAIALGLLAAILENPEITKILQNAPYDIAWLWENYRIGIQGPVLDTRLQHFAGFPELPHSLAEMATTWLALPPWKSIHRNKDGKDGDASGEEEGGE